MSLNDIERAARASRTDAELYALVEAIYESPPPTQERNWLEWKGSLDLTTADGRFAVAKAILGFANRSVAQAELVCEGVAYMVVGVEPGAAVGIPVIDHATLSDKIKKYADTPRWSAHYVEFRGVTVLVIVVERPAGGDPIHTLQSPYSSNQRTSGDGRSGHYAGTVFHRGLAQTAPAGPKEIVMLTERAVQGALRPDLLLTMTAAAEPLTRINISPQQVEEWLTRREAYVRAHSGKPPDPPPPSPPQTTNPMLGRFGGLAGLGDVGRISANLGLTRSQYAEPEDAQEFERRVAGYKVDVRQRIFGHVVRKIVRADTANKVYFTVTNDTEEPVSGAQLTVVVPRDGLFVYTYPPTLPPLPSMPKWPDRFKDQMTTAAAQAVASRQQYDALDPHAGSVTKTSETFEITWDIGDLRPEERSPELEITIIPGMAAPEEIVVTLIGRSTNHRGTTTDTAALAVSSDEWTVDDWFVADRGA